MDAKKKWYYLENNVPQNTLHKQDLVLAVRHVLEQFLKMRILEPEDGGGSRVTKSADYQNKLLSTKS
jgi:hypothetical protein